jgi:hypothetical protein
MSGALRRPAFSFALVRTGPQGVGPALTAREPDFGAGSRRRSVPPECVRTGADERVLHALAAAPCRCRRSRNKFIQGSGCQRTQVAPTTTALRL